MHQVLLNQPKAKAPLARLALLILASSIVGSSGCGGRGLHGANAQDAGTFPEACERYLDVYGACMHRLLPQNSEIADARIANARASLERVSDETQLRETCVNGTTQLRASCQ